MSAPDNSSSNRRYYEHPSHKERSMEVSDFYMNPAHGQALDMSAGGQGNSRMSSDQLRAGVSDSSTDSFYRAKLRDGFVDLRNSYHQKLNQRGPRPFSGSQNQIYSVPNQQPRNRNQMDANRPMSMHGSGYPNAAYNEPNHRDHEHGTTSSRGSADSNHGAPPQGPLFRSSSDLQLENSSNGTFQDRPLRREFGSADLVETKPAAGFPNSTDAEFFDMLSSYKADGAADQRAPAPPGIHSVLRGEAEPAAHPIHSSTTKHLQSMVHAQQSQYQPRQPLPPQYSQQHPPPKPPHSVAQAHSLPQAHQQPYTASTIPATNGPAANGIQVASSPPPNQSVEMIRRSPKSSKKGQRPRSGDVSALLRRLRPTKGEGDASGRSAESSNDPHLSGLLSEIMPEERLRKKAFVHYDCQSVGINFVDAAMKRQNTQIGNTKTGASAASHLDELGDEGLVVSDSRVSQLVGQCPAFINELGDETERNVALTRATSQRKTPQVAGEDNSHLDILRPSLCNGLSILDGLPGTDNRQSLVEKHRGVYILEYRDRGCTYYGQYFRRDEHQNYFGIDENVGPVAISIRREKVPVSRRLTDTTNRHSNSNDAHDHKHSNDTSGSVQQYRVIARTSELRVLRGMILEDALPAAARLSNSSRGLPAKDIIEYVMPEIQLSSLKQATNNDKTKEQVQALDEQGRSDSYKVGIMYCKAGQSTEEEMYNNEHSSPAFTKFLDLIGRKVRLKGFDNFKGGLDNKTDTTGTYSYYTTCQAHEIMFHVSTLLPLENNRQQLLRKRHIGNDIVTVVFQECGSLPFDVTSVRSHFQHVFIIVRVQDNNSDHTRYSVAVTRSKDVPSFGPPISQSYPHNAEFADFVIAKILNAENASHLSDKFQAMAVRTRGEYMKDLATNYVTNNSLDGSSKLGKFSLGGSKKKEKNIGKVVPDVYACGGLVWPTQLQDFGSSTHVEVYLVISADALVVIEMDTSEVIFSCWCSSVIGWTNNYTTELGPASATGLRIYLNQGEFIAVKPIDNEDTVEIMDRLRVVTQGCETQEMILKRNDIGQLGFHVYMDGIISEVEVKGHAWQSGLRTGSRLVEICKVSMITLTHEQMIDLLRTSATVKVVVISPLDGKARSGLEGKGSDYYSSDDHRHRSANINLPQSAIDGEESSAYFSDDETSPQSTVMSVAKRVNTVTLRSSSSGGSSCSPGSTLSGKHKGSERRAQSDTENHHRNRQKLHNRAKSQDQNYSDTDSVSHRRPPAGPVYTAPQSQYGSVPSASVAPYYHSSSKGSQHASPPDSLHRLRNEEHNRPNSAANGARRVIQRHKSWAAKDWRHVDSPRLTNQHLGYSDRGGERVVNSGSQEILAKLPLSTANQYSRPSGQPSSHSNYSNIDGAHFSKKLQRTFSDESLQSPSRRINSPHSLYSSHPGKGPHDVPGVRRGRTGSIPSDPASIHPHSNHHGEEDLDWNKLVSTASKAIESGSSSSKHYVTLVPWQPEPPNTSRSHDSSTDRDNSSLLSGTSTPTQEKTKDLEVRCSRLEHELYIEKRRSKDLERRLQLEKNRNEDLIKEVSELKKENSAIRLS